MRSVRTLAIAATIAVSTSAFIAAPVNASGVGTASGDAVLLGIEIGGGDDGVLAAADLGTDSGSSNSDPAVGTVEAVAATAPLTTSSDLLAAFNQSLAGAEVRSQGEEETDERALLDIADNPVVTGSISATTLRALVDASGPRSALNTGLADLAVAGGLVTLPDLATGLATHVPTTHAIATREARLDRVTVLDLTALLDGLGLPIGSLPLATIGDLLSATGTSVPVSGTAFAALDPLDNAESLTGLVDGVTDPENGAVAALEGLVEAIDDLLGFSAGLLDDLDAVLALLGLDDPCALLDETQAALDAIDPTGELSTLVAALQDALDDANAALGALGIDPLTCETIDDLKTEALALIETLRDDLAGLLGAVALALDDLDLLAVRDVDVEVVSMATSTLDTSDARAEVSIGGFDVAATDITGFEVVAAGVIDDAAATLGGAIDGVLSAVHETLSGVIAVTLLDRGTAVTETDGRITASATLTLLRATITPPAELAAIVDELLGAASLSSVIGDLGGEMPVIAGAMQALGTETTSVVDDVLAAGETIVRVLSFGTEATFRSGPALDDGGIGTSPGTDDDPAARPPADERADLPRTGLGQSGLLLAVALVLSAAWTIDRLRRGLPSP